MLRIHSKIDNYLKNKGDKLVSEGLRQSIIRRKRNEKSVFVGGFATSI